MPPRTSDKFKASRLIEPIDWSMVVSAIFSFKADQTLDAFVDLLFDRKEGDRITDEERQRLQTLKVGALKFENIEKPRFAGVPDANNEMLQLLKVSNNVNSISVEFSARKQTRDEMRGDTLKNAIKAIASSSPDKTLYDALCEIYIPKDFYSAPVTKLTMESLFNQDSGPQSVVNPIFKAPLKCAIDALLEDETLSAEIQAVSKIPGVTVRSDKTDELKARIEERLKQDFDGACEKDNIEEQFKREKVTHERRQKSLKREKLTLESRQKSLIETLHLHTQHAEPDFWVKRRAKELGGMTTMLVLGGLLLAGALTIGFPPIGLAIAGTLIGLSFIGGLFTFNAKEKAYSEHCRKVDEVRQQIRPLNKKINEIQEELTDACTPTDAEEDPISASSAHDLLNLTPPENGVRQLLTQNELEPSQRMHVGPLKIGSREYHGKGTPRTDFFKPRRTQSTSDISVRVEEINPSTSMDKRS